MTLELRKLANGLSAALLCSALALCAGLPSAGEAAPLVACHDSIRAAAIELDGDVQRAVSACLTRGIECEVGASDREGCCTRNAERCRRDFTSLDAAKRRFQAVVEHGRCGDVELSAVLTELGYGNLEGTCSALVPPAPIADLAGMASCLARLIVSRTACLIGTRELPRGQDAVACMGLEPEFTRSTDADLATCNVKTPPVPCEDGKTTVAVALDRAYAGVVVELRYPASVEIPGSGADDRVLGSVRFDAPSALTAVNDQDKDLDGVEETLVASLVTVGNNPPGPFITVTLQCVGNGIPPLGAYGCSVRSASDDGGLPIQVGCSLAVP